MLKSPKVYFNGISFNSNFYKASSKNTKTKTTILRSTATSTTNTTSKIK